MYTLDFTPSDLHANRQGFLSEAQEQRRDADVVMVRTQGRQVIWFFAAFFVFAIVGGGLIEYNNAGQDLAKFLSPSNILGFKIAGAGLSGMMLFTFVAGWWSARSLAHASLRSVEGTAHLVDEIMGRGGMTQAYNLELRRGRFSKFTFRFQNASSMAYFQEGRRYRVYYLPYAIPQALSAEELP
jgi:hypothetical protein